MGIAKTKGVDISYANGNIDLAKVKKAGYKWVMIRCGYGDNYTSQDDKQFANNVKKAEALGMPWGVYLYSYATNQKEAKSEVEHIKRLLKGKKPTLPVAIDIEDYDCYSKAGVMNKKSLTRIVSTILSGIKKAGYYPMLYTGKSWLDNYIDKSVWSKYDIWLAAWTSTCLYSGSNLGIWQYGGETNVIESNSIAGVGVIDKDKCYKDYPTIIKNGGYNNWKKTATKKKKVVKFKCKGALYSASYKDLVGGASKPKVALQKGSQVTWVSDDKFGWSKVKYAGKTYYTLNSNLSKIGLSKCKTVTLTRDYTGFIVTDDNKKGKEAKLKKGTKVTVVCVICNGKYKNWSYVKYNKKKYYIKGSLL